MIERIKRETSKVKDEMLETAFIGIAGMLRAFINAVPIYFLWNWLFPDIFHMTEITFIQSAGICLLFNYLSVMFEGFRDV